MSVQINNGTPKIVNLYSPTRVNGFTIFDEPVPAGFNTITLKVVSATVLIDKLITTR